MSDDNTREWHLDKRVPITLIIALAMHLGTSVWWASGMSEKMVQVERRLEGFAARTSKTDLEVRQQSEEIALLALRMNNTIDSVNNLRVELKITNQLLQELLIERRKNNATP